MDPLHPLSPGGARRQRRGRARALQHPVRHRATPGHGVPVGKPGPPRAGGRRRIVSWLVTRWRVHGGDLQITTGLVRRQSIRVPLSRIQAIDVISPVVARVLGLAEVRVVVAGRGTGSHPAGLPRQREAQRVRAMLLALAHGLASETPEPPAQPLLRIDNGRVVLRHPAHRTGQRAASASPCSPASPASSSPTAPRRPRWPSPPSSAWCPRCSAASTRSTTSSWPRRPTACG